MKQKIDHRIESEDWNNSHSIGQPVSLIEDDGSLTKTQTTSRAWLLSCGIAVVKVADRSGGYMLSRIKAI